MRSARTSFSTCASRSAARRACVRGNLGSGTPQEMMEWVEHMPPLCQFYPGQPAPPERPRRVVAAPVLRRRQRESWACGGNLRPGYYVDEFRRYNTFGGGHLARHRAGHQPGLPLPTEHPARRRGRRRDDQHLPRALRPHHDGQHRPDGQCAPGDDPHRQGADASYADLPCLRPLSGLPRRHRSARGGVRLGVPRVRTINSVGPRHRLARPGRPPAPVRDQPPPGATHARHREVGRGQRGKRRRTGPHRTRRSMPTTPSTHRTPCGRCRSRRWR